jgi:hypothetical protein
MTMFVPLSILTGLGFYYISDLISKKDVIKIAISISLALLVMLSAGYHVSALKYVSATKPVITITQRESLASIINSIKPEQVENLYARHGLRFWATQSTRKYLGVMFYDWDRKTFGIRKSRGGEDIIGSRDPKPGDCLLISKQPMFGAKYETVEFEGVEFIIQKNAQEYFELIVKSDKDASIEIENLASDTDSANENTITIKAVIEKNQEEKIGFVYGNNSSRGKKNLKIKLVYTDNSENTYEFNYIIEENLMQYAQFADFDKIAENEDYIIITPK